MQSSSHALKCIIDAALINGLNKPTLKELKNGPSYVVHDQTNNLIIKTAPINEWLNRFDRVQLGMNTIIANNPKTFSIQKIVIPPTNINNNVVMGFEYITGETDPNIDLIRMTQIIKEIHTLLTPLNNNSIIPINKLDNLLNNQILPIKPRNIISNKEFKMVNDILILLRKIFAERFPQKDYVTIHGDITIHNLVKTIKDNVFVIDWDTIKRAPKEIDLATFTTPKQNTPYPSNILLNKEQATTIANTYCNNYASTDFIENILFASRFGFFVNWCCKMSGDHTENLSKTINDFNIISDPLFYTNLADK